MPLPESSPGVRVPVGPLLCSPFLFHIGIIRPFVVGLKISHSTFIHSSLLTLVSYISIDVLPTLYSYAAFLSSLLSP